MHYKYFAVTERWVLLCLLLSCVPSGEQPLHKADEQSGPASAVQPARPQAVPLAILKTGEYPLWFQLTESGPVLLESIEDACYSAALVPWPLALHISFVLAQGDGLVMAVNRDGFLKLAPSGGAVDGLGLYRFSGGEFWRQYTVGGFVLYDDKPAALLYMDSRFLDSAFPLPGRRVWTFNMESNVPFSLDIPALELFPAEEGWNTDSLRMGPDGLWYFRASKRDGAAPEIRMLRTASLAQAAENISQGIFQNSAMGASLSAAPVVLKDVLSAAFAAAGSASALAISPDVPSSRRFSGTSGSGPVLPAYYRGDANACALVILPTGKGWYINRPGESQAVVPQAFSLPPLPDGFLYTWVGIAGDSLLACWEEQEEYNTGAAGFMVINLRIWT